MGILRTDVVSHSQLEGTGSIVFDGVGDHLTFGAHSAFTAGSSDVTFELEWTELYSQVYDAIMNETRTLLTPAPTSTSMST